MTVPRSNQNGDVRAARGILALHRAINWSTIKQVEAPATLQDLIWSSPGVRINVCVNRDSNRKLAPKTRIAESGRPREFSKYDLDVTFGFIKKFYTYHLLWKLIIIHNSIFAKRNENKERKKYL